ncbi:phospholipid phosphatase [Bacteroidia bacterium]|nr:phospholipid phosphatase [Bacteroidia bacterium]
MIVNLKSLFFLLAGNIALLQAQTSDTCRIVLDSVIQTENHPSFRKTKKAIGIAIPAAMITYGILSVESDGLKQLDYSTRNELTEDNSMWYNSLDNYLQFSPAMLAFGLKLGGMESKHQLPDMFILYALSNVLESSVVFTTKQLTGRRRPDGSNSHSFPSGHTAMAFVAAEFLHQEYGAKSPWLSAAGYGMATLIGVSRVYNNKHWVSDVVAGAGVGILSTKIVYWVYPSIKKSFSKKDRKQQTFICPTYNKGSLGITFSCAF